MGVLDRFKNILNPNRIRFIEQLRNINADILVWKVEYKGKLYKAINCITSCHQQCFGKGQIIEQDAVIYVLLPYDEAEEAAKLVKRLDEISEELKDAETTLSRL